MHIHCADLEYYSQRCQGAQALAARGQYYTRPHSKAFSRSDSFDAAGLPPFNATSR